MSQQKAIRHHEFGKPQDVLCVETVGKPEPGPKEVRVKLLAATINPSDYGMIGGSYGRLRELPAVAGREGVGEVEALGEQVTSLAVGTRVRFPEEGSWQEYACLPADEVLVVPTEVPIDQAAISFINPPTAYCLLTKIVELPKGSWIVQNAGNSAVGISVIQMAKALGLKTISQVRREELIEPLKAMGADHVVLEGSAWPKTVKDLTGGEPVRLALNSIGGESASDQIKALGEGGTHVTFGGMVGDPVRFPTRFLIFNDVRLIGFWWDRWCRSNGPAGVRQVMDAVYGMMVDGTVQLPTEATYSFDQYAEAFAHDKSPRLGKVLLKP
ncbi:zinc-dependent alcohol dehydrogenase family protein [Coraliomargarita akajimensis]|uniref:enoyl-[acyl-carrier-protein] reductase n=1 Tax=Coraliomargarita akajimensis (strain DSM 45221 / IAM 15411 / JCM 23193 / KCTC 12865 / 04OKA010-24) TaxID=583355 RepID=D5EKQ8_CORAD|nr:zinc-dependent alcohol dehydrogenase family protein [Coraliomargarita akajimensis]ADE54965.1 Alcohol dehydrogenase zinc-binding domain protein [Coraliomargarita akajimensis DSM 45221]